MTATPPNSNNNITACNINKTFANSFGTAGILRSGELHWHILRSTAIPLPRRAKITWDGYAGTER